jgi:hypothetical protein
MVKKYKTILLNRLRELRHQRNDVNKQVEKHKSTIWGYIYLANCPENENCLKAQKELPILQLQLKNILGYIRALEKKYQFEFDPEELDEEERDIPTPIEVPNDINDQYQIPNGCLELTEIFLIN